MHGGYGTKVVVRLLSVVFCSPSYVECPRAFFGCRRAGAAAARWIGRSVTRSLTRSLVDPTLRCVTAGRAAVVAPRVAVTVSSDCAARISASAARSRKYRNQEMRVWSSG